VNVVLRALFVAVVRPAGLLLRGRDPLRLRPPADTNWRSTGR
jgi:hypothetical protein